MPVTISTDDAQSGWLKIHIVGEAAAIGLLGQVANPEGVLLHIHRAFIYVTAPAGLAAVPLIGIAATGVSSNTLMATWLATSAAGTVWQVVGMDRASEAAATTPWGVLWPAASFLTITNSAQVSTGLVADLYVHYIRLA